MSYALADGQIASECERSRSTKRAGGVGVKECKESAVLKRDGERETENKRENGNEKASERARWGGCPRAGNDVEDSKCIDSTGEVGGSNRLQGQLEISIERGESNTEKDSECKSASEGQR